MWLNTGPGAVVRHHGRPCRMIRVKGDPLPKTSDVTRAEYEALLLRVKQLEVAVVARTVTESERSNVTPILVVTSDDDIKDWMVYGLFDPAEPEPFYIGITGDPFCRARTHACADRPVRARIRAIMETGRRPELRELEQHDTCSAARKREAELIETLPGLLNLPTGGRPVSGFALSNAERQKRYRERKRNGVAQG